MASSARSNYGEGRRVVFHGAFTSKRDARDREEERPGSYIIERKIRGHRRYVVVSEKGPPRRNRGGRGMKFLVNPPAGRSGPRKGGSTMAKRKARRRYPKGHPKAGKFMSDRAIAASKAARKRKTKRNPGRTVAKRNAPKRRAAPKRKATRRRSPARRNPPRRRVDIMGSLWDGSVEAVQILIGKAAARSLPDLVGAPKQGNLGLAVQAATALVTGYVAGMFLSPDAARAMMAGGLTAPIETLIVSYNVPWLGSALSPVTTAGAVGAYASGGGMMSPRLSGYVKRRPAPVVAARGMSGYVSSADRGLTDYGD